jgi:hypothetical protein
LSGYSQACKNDFIEGITNAYYSKVKRFNRIAIAAVNRLDKNGQINVINIPVVLARSYIIGDIEPDTLLCLLNPRRIEFDAAIILKDSIFHGVVHLSATRLSKSGDFFDSNHSFSVFMEPLVKKIMEIKPDIIFRVVNIPGVYWYLKDKQLFVLTFKHTGNKMLDFETHKLSTYIDSIFSGYNMFLVPRQIWVISGPRGGVRY